VIKIKKKKIGFFIVHGFLGNATTGFDDLPRILKKNRIDFWMTQLQGHGYDDDINTFNYKKCLRQVEIEYQVFQQQYEKVYIMGFSMGGVIAGHLASHYGADKMVLISPAFKYGGGNKIISKVGDFFKAHKGKNEEDLPKIIEKVLNDNAAQELMDEFIADKNSTINLAEDYADTLKGVKISVFTNFMRLVSNVKKHIITIDAPTRIYISEHDEIVPIDAAFYIFDKVTSTDKRIEILTKVGHRIMVSELRKDVIIEIIKFLYGKRRVKWPKEKK